MRVLKTSIFLCFICSVTSLFAQQPTQTIRGKVIDTDTKQTLVGATVSLINSDPSVGTTSDEEGTYRLEEVNIGRYEMMISYIGYESQIIPEVLLESGKELILNVELKENATTLDEVTVYSSRHTEPTNATTSIHTLTLEETFRFPATFYDPARLAASFAGVVNQNDQANNIIIRGNAPSSMTWRLEGVDIVNPNHLSNAGTFSDRATQNGGGVNILSAQLLGTSRFLTGAFPAEYGNTLGGVMDMQLRSGNNEQLEFTGQIGLIGIDLAAEGPLSKNAGSSFLVNYRYSTLGLLSAMGVDLGDEAISFQDLAFNFSFPNKKGGELGVFGMQGISKNVFETERDPELWEFEKDRNDITFDNKMGAWGISYSQPLSNKLSLKTIAAFSTLENERRQNSIANINFSEIDIDKQKRLSANVTLNYKANSNHSIKAGTFASYIQNDIFLDYTTIDAFYDGQQDGALIQPFVNWQFRPSTKLTTNVGLHYMHYTFNKTSAIEPRASLKWRFLPEQNISLAYGLHSQTQLPQLYGIDDLSNNYKLELTKAHHLVLGYKNAFNKSTSLQVEVYYQDLFDVPISSNLPSTFSGLNAISDYTFSDSLVSEGTGKNYGVELSLQKFLTNNYYFLWTGMLYESKYTAADGIERNTRFNGNYATNLTVGKEFVWINKKGKNRTLGINSRVSYVGGLRETPIDQIASSVLGRTVFDDQNAFSIKQKDFFKIDLRIYYKRNKPKYSSTLALDIQNVTNAQNIAFSYFDNLKADVITKYQLGLIPLLNYRIEF